jgi:uncharacterized protein involved in exopolysaccharide biosynthesis
MGATPGTPPVAAGPGVNEMALPPLPALAALEADVLTTLETSPLAADVIRLEEEVRALRALREQENANALQLIQQRDLAWEALRTVSSKVTELKLARAAAGSEVRFAAEAVAPIQPERGLSLLIVVAVAAAAGLMVALFVVFLANYQGRKPLFGKAPTPSAQPSA